MITLKEAKRILGDDTMSDKEVEAIVNELQLWVELAFDNWIEERNKLKELKVNQK